MGLKVKLMNLFVLAISFSCIYSLLPRVAQAHSFADNPCTSYRYDCPHFEARSLNYSPTTPEINQRPFSLGLIVEEIHLLRPEKLIFETAVALQKMATQKHFIRCGLSPPSVFV